MNTTLLKYGLSAFVTIFMMSNITHSADFNCLKLESKNCYKLGYQSTSCNDDNYIKCPFNTSYMYCDKEADVGDFKFSWTNSSNGGWEDKTDTHSGKFIVATNNYSSSYCAYGIGVGETLTSTSYKAHSHGSMTFTSGGFNCGTYYSQGQCITGFPTEGTDRIYYTSGTTVTNSGTTGTLVPVHKTARLYSFLGNTDEIFGNTDIAPETYMQNANINCETLGYTDTVSNCPNQVAKDGYVVCPFDSTKVKCDLEAKAGEIKYSFDTNLADVHDGWILCDGRTFASIDASFGSGYSKSELASLLGTGSVPSYKGVFLKVGNASTSLNLDTVPAHSHEATGAHYQGSHPEQNWYCTDRNDKFTAMQFSTSSYPSSYSGTTDESSGTETRPANFAVNMYIYSGRLNIK